MSGIDWGYNGYSRGQHKTSWVVTASAVNTRIAIPNNEEIQSQAKHLLGLESIEFEDYDTFVDFKLPPGLEKSKRNEFFDWVVANSKSFTIA